MVSGGVDAWNGGWAIFALGLVEYLLGFLLRLVPTSALPFGLGRWEVGQVGLWIGGLVGWRWADVEGGWGSWGDGGGGCSPWSAWRPIYLISRSAWSMVGSKAGFVTISLQLQVMIGGDLTCERVLVAVLEVVLSRVLAGVLIRFTQIFFVPDSA